MNRIFDCTAIAAMLWLTGGSAIAAGTAQTPFQIVNQLGDRMYATGETTGKEADFLAAIEQARQALQDFAANGNDPAAFVEKGPHGTTPLLMAAKAGYPEIVAELLKNKQVKASIDDLNEDGFSPWAFTNFAFQEAIWVCNPSVFADPFKSVPKLVEQPYYLSGPERPYRKTRRLLEAAGAKHDMAATKQFWLTACKLATPETRQKVAAASDLLVEVETEGAVLLAARLRPLNR